MFDLPFHGLSVCFIYNHHLNNMEKEDSKIESTLRLVRSEEFTPEMAINYLYHWRQKEQLL